MFSLKDFLKLKLDNYSTCDHFNDVHNWGISSYEKSFFSDQGIFLTNV